MLPFLKNLEKIGIKATFRNLEVNVFKNRLDNFDFDIAIITFPISRLPGNEQKEFWGSASAGVSGSFNLIGIKNPVVDELLDGMVAAQNKEDYQAYIRALDRVLLNEHYMIMQWYAPRKQVAYHNRFAHPETSLKVGFSALYLVDKGKRIMRNYIIKRLLLIPLTLLGILLVNFANYSAGARRPGRTYAGQIPGDERRRHRADHFRRRNADERRRKRLPRRRRRARRTGEGTGKAVRF